MLDSANHGLISTPWIRQLVIWLLNNWSQHLFDVAVSLGIKETITCTYYVYVMNLPAAQFCSHKILIFHFNVCLNTIVSSLCRFRKKGINIKVNEISYKVIKFKESPM